MEYTQTNNNLHIVDSYQVSKKCFENVIHNAAEVYIAGHGQYPDWYAMRKIKSMCAEWAVHNFLYNLHIKRERTKDVDLNYPTDEPEWLYTILGAIAYIFIK